MNMMAALVWMRLGGFIAALTAFGLSCYLNWPYSGWLMFLVVVLGLMLCSLQATE